MQDRSAGVVLHEHRRGKHVYHYFNGDAAVDWLVQWQFVCTREQAVMLASELLKAGFFHPIDLHVGERGYVGRPCSNSGKFRYAFGTVASVFSSGCYLYICTACTFN